MRSTVLPASRIQAIHARLPDSRSPAIPDSIVVDWTPPHKRRFPYVHIASISFGTVVLRDTWYHRVRMKPTPVFDALTRLWGGCGQLLTGPHASLVLTVHSGIQMPPSGHSGRMLRPPARHRRTGDEFIRAMVYLRMGVAQSCRPRSIRTRMP